MTQGSRLETDHQDGQLCVQLGDGPDLTLSVLRCH